MVSRREGKSEPQRCAQEMLRRRIPLSPGLSGRGRGLTELRFSSPSVVIKVLKS